MPLGSELNAVLPGDTDLAAVSQGKLMDTLSRVIAAVEAPVSWAAINFTGTDVTLAGTTLESVTRVDGINRNAAIVGGTTFVNGDWQIGSVRVTLRGALDAGSTGAIVGDYGRDPNARLSYSNALAQYSFTSNPTTHATLTALDFELIGSVGGDLLMLAAVVGDAGVWTFPTPPTDAGSFVLTVGPDGVITASNTTETNPVVSSLDVSTDMYYSARQRNLSPASCMFRSGWNTPAANLTQANKLVAALTTAILATWELDVSEGDEITEVGFRMRIPLAGSGHVSTVTLYADDVAIGSGATTGLVGTYTTNGTVGYVSSTASGSSVTVESGKKYWLRFDSATGATAGNELHNIYYKVGRGE